MVTFSILNQFYIHLIQIVLERMTLTFSCYLLFRLPLWTYDCLNTKYLHISSIALTYLKSLTLNTTHICLQLHDFTTNKSVNLYLSTVFGNPADIYCERQFIAGRTSLNQIPSYDFIALK